MYRKMALSPWERGDPPRRVGEGTTSPNFVILNKVCEEAPENAHLKVCASPVRSDFSHLLESTNSRLRTVAQIIIGLVLHSGCDNL